MICALDVGQGDSTLIVLPDDRAVVFDCADDRVLGQVLADWRIETIEAFVLSHLDQDHVAGALPFLRGYAGEIRHVYMAPDRAIAGADPGARRATELLEVAGEGSRDTATRARQWELHVNYRDTRPIVAGDGWAISLLAPAVAQSFEREREGAWEDANRYSSILRVQAGGKVMLIGGDAPLRTWQELPPQELPAAVVRVPHHGGVLDDGGIPPGWDPVRLYGEIGAETALISVGTNNPYRHPIPAWVGPVTGGACRLLCTQVTGRCHGPLERDADQIERHRKRVILEHRQWTLPQYRHLTDDLRDPRPARREVPCAGTVIVTMHLSGQIDVLPAPRAGHDAVVDRWKHPLCRVPHA